jgi:tetratricopeptide (TPR) repeat protein
MPSRFVWLLASLASMFLIAGCSTNASGKKNAGGAAEEISTGGPPQRTDAELEKRGEAHARFLAGLSYDQSDQPDKALLEFEKALEGDPGNEALSIDLSRRYLQRKEFDKAAAVLKKAADAPGASGIGFARLGLVYLQQGKTNDAIEASRTAIRRDPGSIAGYQGLFHLHRSLGDTNEAWKVVEQAAKQPRPDAPFLIDLAHLYLAVDADAPSSTNSLPRQRARDLLVRAEGMSNTNLLSLQRLAQGFVFLGDMKRSAQVYQKMLEADPELIGVREALAELYLRQNEPQRAAEQLREIIRDTPTNPQAYYFLGAIAYEQKRFEEALENYRKALLLGLDNQQVYFDIALANLSLQKPREALDYLERARRKFRRSFVGEFYSGIAYMRLKDYTNALDHFTAAEIVASATETNRLTHHFYFELGAAHERAGKIADAERYFEKCLSLSPKMAEALNYLGYMWAERGTNLTRAHEMIDQAVKLNPTNAAYLDSLGWVLFKMGRTQEALEPIRKAVELTEEPDATLFDHLGDIYAAMNEWAKAREFWQKLIALEPNASIEAKLKRERPPPPETGK